MRNIIKIIKISKPLHHLVAILGVLILLSSSLALVAPILSKFIVDQIVAQIQSGDGNIRLITILLVISFLTSLISVILSKISDRIGDHFAGRLKKFLTERFYEKVLTLPQTYFDSEVSGKILNQLTRGIVSINSFLNSSSNFILPTFVQSIFIIGVLAYFSPSIAVFTFSLFPIYLSLSYYSTKKWGKKEVIKNQIEDSYKGRMTEVIANIRLVKGFINEKQEYHDVATKLTKSNDIYKEQSQTYHIFDFFRNLSLIIILFIINLIVFYNAFTGKMSVGEMVMILQLVNQARIPLFAMSFILTQIQTAEAGSKEYFEVMSLESTENFRKTDKSALIKNPEITFKGVSFNYEKSDRVLQDVSFDIKNHESVALVGHSGAGKSTIVNLILKLYEPTEGEIFLNQKSYKVLSHNSIRKNIALVFQENELFSTTIKENVAYGPTPRTDKEIIDALKLANAYEFVMKLPEGINSHIGERGVRLSGGQKQRIQIARAILKNAPILILDEATSSLDAKSEKEVQVAIDNLVKNKLVIVIAHRFSTIQSVDKIVVVDQGRIVNYGTPQELAKAEGVYRDLLNYQVEGNKKLLEKFEIF